MKRLNLRDPKPFDFSDQSGNEPPRARFICVAEGPTEESYILGIRNNKAKLQIKSDVSIEVMPKEEGQEGYSHPMQLVEACLYKMGRRDEEGNDIPETEWEENCQWRYDPEVDTVCVIFDRDYKDLDKLLGDIYDLCEAHHIFVAISNPNFELWLLMHFPQIEQYDREWLLTNRKNLRGELFPEASKEKKCLEILVSQKAEGYSKGRKIHFERFLPGIEMALEQTRMFCEDARSLRTELGTTVGALLRKMRMTKHASVNNTTIL